MATKKYCPLSGTECWKDGCEFWMKGDCAILRIAAAAVPPVTPVGDDEPKKEDERDERQG